MPISLLRLIKNSVEFCDKVEIKNVPRYTRGIYVLYKRRSGNSDVFDVVYIGMAAAEKASVRRRLNRHKNQKGRYWTHFSVFQVWENIGAQEVKELEGIVRHLYHKDSRANKLATQKRYRPLIKLCSKEFSDWE